MKLKIFSFLKPQQSADGGAGKPSEAANDQSANADAGDEGEGSEDDAEGEAGEGSEEDAEPEASVSAEAPNNADLASAYNAMGAHVGTLTAEVSTLSKKVLDLQGDRTAEVASAASVEARNITASQGVPAENVGGAAASVSSDAPKTAAEFNEQYGAINDPVKAGAFFAKYYGKFN